MKHPAHIYAQTVRDVIAQGVSEDDAMYGLAWMIQKNGDAAYSDRIGRALDRELVVSRGGKWVEIEVAHETGAAEKLKNLFSSSNRVTTHINPALIAGARVTINSEEELDLSFERKVKQLFIHPES